jgi:hypothetical protein
MDKQLLKDRYYEEVAFAIARIIQLNTQIIVQYCHTLRPQVCTKQRRPGKFLAGAGAAYFSAVTGMIR